MNAPSSMKGKASLREVTEVHPAPAKVRAKPEDGKANAAVMELIADALGVATSRLQLLRGATSREKLIKLRD